jgi:hypothetical protein
MSRPQIWTEYQFDRLVLDHLAPVLKAHGFRKSVHTWQLRRPGAPTMWGVVNLEKHRDNSLYDIRFTINLGVRVSAEPWTVRWWPGISHCDERVRIGELIGQGPELWWRIVPATTGPRSGVRCVEPQTPEFLPLVQDVGVRWVKDRLAAHMKAASG